MIFFALLEGSSFVYPYSMGVKHWPGPSAEYVGDICCVDFGGFCRGSSWRIFVGIVLPTKMSAIYLATKSAKLRRPKNKNPTTKSDPQNRADLSFRVSVVLQYLGVRRYPDAGENSTKSVIVTPLSVCAPRASRNLALRAVSWASSYLYSYLSSFCFSCFFLVSFFVLVYFCCFLFIVCFFLFLFVLVSFLVMLSSSGNVPSAPTTTESLIRRIIRCYISSLSSTSQNRSATTPGEFRCYIRCRFE